MIFSKQLIAVYQRDLDRADDKIGQLENELKIMQDDALKDMAEISGYRTKSHILGGQAEEMRTKIDLLTEENQRLSVLLREYEVKESLRNPDEEMQKRGREILDYQARMEGTE